MQKLKEQLVKGSKMGKLNDVTIIEVDEDSVSFLLGDFLRVLTRSNNSCYEIEETTQVTLDNYTEIYDLIAKEIEGGVILTNIFVGYEHPITKLLHLLLDNNIYLGSTLKSTYGFIVIQEKNFKLKHLSRYEFTVKHFDDTSPEDFRRYLLGLDKELINN